MSKRLTMAISLGDPAGVGPELLIKVLPLIPSEINVIVIGSRSGLNILQAENKEYLWEWTSPSREIKSSIPYNGLRVSEIDTGIIRDALWVDPTENMKNIKLGVPSRDTGMASVEAITLSYQLIKEGLADFLVTLPISKEAVIKFDSAFTGHTKYLQYLSSSKKTMMFFMSPRMNVGLNTVHQSLKSVIDEMDPEVISDNLEFLLASYSELVGTSKLNWAVAALNPHAGENGAFGTEELIIQKGIDSCIQRLEILSNKNISLYDRDKFGASIYSDQKPSEPWSPYLDRPSFSSNKLSISSPLSADTLFGQVYNGKYDGVLAMYHDQGLIPIKLLEPDRAVNVTLGLPFVRVSPDHGTAFDIAGQWKASSKNLINTILLGIRLAKRQQGQFN